MSMSSRRVRHRGARGPRRRDDATEGHTPEYAAALRALLLSAYALIDALTSDTTDAASLGRVVTDYVARALTAGICRARIRDALELLVGEHGGLRWIGEATAIALLATRDPLGSANVGRASIVSPSRAVS